MNIELITTLIAIYGAILSTIAIVWNVYNKLMDKPKIRVSSGVGVLSLEPVQEIISFEAINSGRYTVFLSSAGINFKNNKKMFFVGVEDQLPKELLPGKNHTIFRPLYELIAEIKKVGEPDYVWFRDQTGKEYRGGMVNLKNFMGNINEK